MYFRFRAFFKPFSFSCYIVYPFNLFVMFFGCNVLVQIVRFLWHPVFGMFSCQPVDRIFFRCFGKSCFVCIVVPFVDISLISLLSPVLSDYYHYWVFHISVSWWFFTPWEFFTSAWADGLSLKFEWLQVSSSLQNSAQCSCDRDSVICWIVSTRPLISMSSCPINNPSVTVPRAPITVGINITFIFHSFFYSLARSKYLFFFLLSFSFNPWLAGTAKSSILQVLFFSGDYYRVWSSGRD